jgi:hypothetical protein
VDDTPILGLNEDRRMLQQLVAAGGVPAFAARAQRVQEAFDALVAVCRRERAAFLKVARSQLGTLQELAGTWSRLLPWLQDEAQLDIFPHLCAEMRPNVRTPSQPTSSKRTLRRALHELVASLDYVNLRWQKYLQELDLSRVNGLRDGYNRYYVLEKECLLGSPRLARQGFRPLPPLTRDDILALFPSLPVPALR